MNHSINPVLRFNWQHIPRCAFTTFIVNCFHVYHVKWETRMSVAVKWKSLLWFCYFYVGLLANTFHCKFLSHISMLCNVRCMLLFIHHFGMEWFHISTIKFFNVFSSSSFWCESSIEQHISVYVFLNGRQITCQSFNYVFQNFPLWKIVCNYVVNKLLNEVNKTARKKTKF